jgi:hypothetical protein
MRSKTEALAMSASKAVITDLQQGEEAFLGSQGWARCRPSSEEQSSQARSQPSMISQLLATTQAILGDLPA